MSYLNAADPMSQIAVRVRQNILSYQKNFTHLNVHVSKRILVSFTIYVYVYHSWSEETHNLRMC